MTDGPRERSETEGAKRFAPLQFALWELLAATTITCVGLAFLRLRFLLYAPIFIAVALILRVVRGAENSDESESTGTLVFRCVGTGIATLFFGALLGVAGVLVTQIATSPGELRPWGEQTPIRSAEDIPKMLLFGAYSGFPFLAASLWVSSREWARCGALSCPLALMAIYWPGIVAEDIHKPFFEDVANPWKWVALIPIYMIAAGLTLGGILGDRMRENSRKE